MFKFWAGKTCVVLGTIDISRISTAIPRVDPVAGSFLLLKDPLKVEKQKMNFKRTPSEVRVIYNI